MDNMNRDEIKIKLLDIPIESSLGLLAYGDIAFRAWRKRKIENRENRHEEE